MGLGMGLYEHDLFPRHSQKESRCWSMTRFKISSIYEHFKSIDMSSVDLLVDLLDSVCSREHLVSAAKLNPMLLHVPSTLAPGSSHSPVVPRRFPNCICRRCWQGWGLKLETSWNYWDWSLLSLQHQWVQTDDLVSIVSTCGWPKLIACRSTSGIHQQEISVHNCRNAKPCQLFNSSILWSTDCRMPTIFLYTSYQNFTDPHSISCNCHCRTLLGQCRCWWPDHNCSWIQGQDCALDHAKVDQIAQDVRSTNCTLLASFNIHLHTITIVLCN